MRDIEREENHKHKHCLLYREHEIVVNHQHNQSCLHGISLCGLISQDEGYKRGRKIISINIVLLYEL